jgi:PKD repeat protein
MASPLVAGLAGLVWSVNPALTNNDVKNCILTTADNINSVNGSYIGQLGSGRINAQAAVNCASATLNWPPVADFVGIPTTVTAGASVTFTNLSTYNPTSYSWSFPGGIPATSTAANPPAITYSTPGVYNVSLTVTNANGNDTETKNSYITVNANTGCDTLNFSPFTSPYSAYIYNAGPGNGFVAGTNTYNDKAKANYTNCSPYTYVTHALVWLGKAHSLTPTKTVTIFVKNGTGGTVGANLTNGTKTLTMADLMFDVNNNYLTVVEFDSPVLLPASKEIFIGVDYSNLSHAAGDSLAIVTTYQNEINPGNGYEQWSDNSWNTYMTGWGIHLDNYISAVCTDVPANATISANPTTLCSGSSVFFDAGSSTYDDDMLWTLPGGVPVQSGNPTVTAFYNTPGTYQAYLEVIGGACGAYAVDSITITVNPTPVMNVTPATDTICPGGLVNLTATGATSYSWSPATGLSNPGIANPVSTPSSNITYTVTGTTGSCSGNQYVTIIVLDQPPVADFITSMDTACTNQPVNFNGAVSTGETSYEWTFTGGSISTSTAPSPDVTYASAGTYPVQLIVQNTCGLDDTLTQNIVVEICAGMDDITGLGAISAFINPDNNHVYITFNISGGHHMHLNIVDAVGRLIYTGNQIVSYQGQIVDIDATNLARGVYSLRVTEGEKQYVMKFYR